MHNVITIIDGKLKRAEIEGTLEDLQAVVGGLITTLFTIPSPVGTELITGYVNDDGIALGLPINTGIVHDPKEYTVPAFGNILISGVTRQGESRSLTDEEQDAIVKVFVKRQMMFPVIEGSDAKRIPFVPVSGFLRLDLLQPVEV